MEIPLEKIKEDLKLGAKFKFTHYEERFNIDPKKIGKYNKKSALYKRYTSSDKNTAITPAIRKTARKIASKETNPYVIAKKFYDHIVYNLDYSFTPHAAIEALNIPESVFV
ncbi:transglutaminase domain-containing protein, partial [Patescibacteria group bacterium]|nr:transglutaminase domain-containing protein [Patescibacteria group bacterium]